MLPVPQASGILASLGQAAFLWDLTADTIAWSDNADAVFTDIPPEALTSGDCPGYQPIYGELFSLGRA